LLDIYFVEIELSNIVFDYSKDNPLSCYCEDIGFIIEIPGVKQRFRGKCASPEGLVDRPLDDCQRGKNGIWRQITKSSRNFTKY